MRSETPNAITHGVIWKQILKFFIPVALGSFFQQMYNTVDALIVGNFVGVHALAAVGGVTSSVISLIVNFFVSISSGATVVIAQYYGADNKDGVFRVMHTTAALALAIGVCLTVPGILLVPKVLTLLNQPQELLADATIYMRIYFAGIIPALVYNIGASVLHAVGDSKRPMYYLIACCLVNIVLDLLFILVFRMAVAGAALATVIAQTVSAVLVSARLLRTSDCYRLTVRKIRIYTGEIRAIVRIGMPAGMQALLYSFSNVFIQSRINLYGADTVAAWTVLGKIDDISWLILGAFGISMTTFVGQNFGAGRMDRVRRSIYVAGGMALTFTALFSFLVMTFSEPLYRLFGASSTVLAISKQMLWLFVPFYSIYVPVEILLGAMRGMGVTFIPTMITCVGVCLVRVLWILIAYLITPSFLPVIVSYPVSWLCASAAFILYYKSNRWLPKAESAA